VADVFAFQADGTVQAITADGTVAWTADVSKAQYVDSVFWAVPDFQGGLVVTDDTGDCDTYRLDGITGRPYPRYTPSDGSSALSSPVVHPDGTIFTAEDLPEAPYLQVTGIDPTTGAVKFRVPADTAGCDRGDFITQIIIAGDGYAYMSYSCTVHWDYTHVVSHLGLLRVNSSGQNNQIFDLTESDTGWAPTPMITNGDQGILLAWYKSGSDDLNVATATGGSLGPIGTLAIPGGLVSGPLLQTQDGTFITIGGTWEEDGMAYSLVAFDATGNVRWMAPGNYMPMIATADGGVIAKLCGWAPYADCTGPAVTFDQNGNATGQMAILPTYSWFGNSYQVGSVDQVSAGLLDIADSFWAFAQGNASGNGTANRPLAKTVQQLIAQIALGYVGSQNWVGLGHPACNQFVQKVLEDSGQQVPYSTNWIRRVADFFGLLHSPLYYPALAGDWASRTSVLGCWHNVTFNGPPRLGGENPLPADLSKPGDIIAEAINYFNATGHVGIVAGAQQTVSADSAAACFPPYSPTETIDISDYGFRPDNWVDPYKDPQTGQPCRTSGKKSNAVVKRFVCQ
jgi:hypothetical protein